MKSQSNARAAFGRLTAITALVVAFVALGHVAQSAPPNSGMAIWQVADGNQRFSVSGTVESVSYASNSVRISASGQQVKITITPTTAIEYRGEAGSIADIRRGSKISARGVVRDGQKIALSIVVK